MIPRARRTAKVVTASALIFGLSLVGLVTRPERGESDDAEPGVMMGTALNYTPMARQRPSQAPLDANHSLCLELLHRLASATPLLALHSEAIAWLSSKEPRFLHPLSLGVLEENLESLVKAIPETVRLLRQAGEADPRLFDADPMIHVGDVLLEDAHLLLLPNGSGCALHIATIFARGEDASGAPAFYWIAHAALSDSSAKVMVKNSPRAFSMQLWQPLSLHEAKFPQRPTHAILGAKDGGLLEWELSFPFRECPWHLAHHFRQHHFDPDNERRTRAMKTRLRAGFQALMNRFDRQRIPAFALAGTLLGWARECDVLAYAAIPQNTDVDFGVMAAETKGQAQLLRAMAAERQQPPTLTSALGNFAAGTYEFRFTYAFDPPLPLLNDGSEKPLYKAIAMDLFVLFPHTSIAHTAHYSIVYAGEKRKWHNINVPTIRREEICSSSVNGVLIRVPCEPDGFLEAAYGKDWAHPRQKWSYGGGAANFLKAGTWTAAEDERMIQKKFDTATLDERRRKLGPDFA